jgi:protein-tyrosine phosphatase
MRGEPIPAPPGWKMQVFEVVPALSIATRLDTSSEYGTLDIDVIVDLEDWEAAWAPPVPLGRLYVSFPMDDGDEVDPTVRQLAVFIASLVTAGRRVLVHCTEGLNRSGVVVARALMAMGLTASDAIDLVRRQRGLSVDGFPALGNDAFVAWLHREGHQASP